jgi:hypothetical protein
MPSLSQCFRDLTSRIDLVRGHAFDSGFDEGPYFNFTFETNHPFDLWHLIQTSILRSEHFRDSLAASMMAVCTGEHGWDDYIQLCHWDSAVECGPAPAV